MNYEILTILSPQLTDWLQAGIYDLWQASLSVLAKRSRSNLLSDIDRCLPIIAGLGEQEAIREVLQAVQDVTAWWP